ncbi:hypothetical protein MTR67_023338 [Solanum verrucosum]|uniref:Malic enzyme NAD-binding domain-containing protein n=1 Tax=Solanum verrucosum TaxID=315347 RepID=A0AAF0QV99_SOLVR|nr:hypothetical protein MTR67_023338 [Solanum verrucosum]
MGCGLAGTGIAELIALVISKKGLIVNARNESLQAHKKPWAHEHEPVNNLLDTVKAIKPAAIIGTSGVGRTFTEEVIEAMSSINKRPLIMAFSNPTAQSECTTEEAYTWSERVDTTTINLIMVKLRSFVQYIFPGFGFGLVMVGAICVHNDMLVEACK